MVISVPIFVEQDPSMVKYVLTNAIQATHALGQVRTRVTMASGLKVDFTARVNLKTIRGTLVVAMSRLILHSKA